MSANQVVKLMQKLILVTKKTVSEAVKEWLTKNN